MSKTKSKYDSDASNSPPRRRDRSRSKEKSKWESPEDDRRRSKDRRYDRSRERDRDRGETSSKYHRDDDRNSRRDDYRRNDRDRRRDSPDNKRRRDSPDDRRDRRDDRRRDDRNYNRGGRKDFRNRRDDVKDSDYKWGKNEVKDDPDQPPAEKEKPNFGLSGALAKEKNTFKGVEIKYTEPQEAKIPKRRWRLYQFKGDQSLPVLHIHRQSAYLIGRDRKICDMAIDHPSASKQHAALQYRLVKYEKEDGTFGKRVRPYIIDLGSSNGTFLNNNKIEPQRYYELMEKDVIKFAFSSREYVLLHESSKDDEGEEDDNHDDEPDPESNNEQQVKTE